MQSVQIIGKMNEYLHVSTHALANWLSGMLPRVSKDWWKECVMAELNSVQLEHIDFNKISSLFQLDIAALLRVANRNWYRMRDVAYLPQKERDCLRDMFGVRNRWAHCSSELTNTDSIQKDFATIRSFLMQILADESVINEISLTIDSISLDTEIPANLELIPKSLSVVVEEPAIAEKSMVRLVSDPSVLGMVCSVTRVNDTLKYEVFVNGEMRSFYQGQIEIVQPDNALHVISIVALQNKLTAYQLSRPGINSLYSLNAARVDFVPYQFRPALKIIKSDVPRLLIADSVGVGKTIEAGLVLKELSVRSDIQKVLIICPKPLVAERKWELEMKRFDEDFIPVDGPVLRQIVSDTHRDGEWPDRFSKVIVPLSLLDKDLLFGKGGTRKSTNYGLLDLDPPPHFDLVIVDEAHHIRNSTTQAYAAVKYFCDNADAVMFLTATPLQTSDDDLYTLLNVLRPDIIIDKETFSEMKIPNKDISKASHFARTADDDWQEQALKHLQFAAATRWGEAVILLNPAYSSAKRILIKKEPTREERIQLIEDIESLHSFSGMINRTRRQDIQDFCIRRSHTIESSFTPIQRSLHDELLDFEAKALSAMHGSQSVKFMMSTIRRQAASCIFGLAPLIRGIVHKRLDQLADDPDFEETYSNEDPFFSMIQEMSARVLAMAEKLPSEDPKMNSLVQIIAEKNKQDNNKIILFSTFRHTLRYLKEHLRKLGIRVAQIDGSVKDEDRLNLRHRFEQSRQLDTALDVLLFTEVGSEGLDYQFCDTLINYDLPWNPMRIEQRIGRIDRRGQKSDIVNIYNMITANTVDADIYYRCLLRIGVFEESIGECEEILGKIGKALEAIALSPTLTETEKQLKFEQITDNEIRRIQELKRLEREEKQFFGFDLSSFVMSREVQNAENAWVSSSLILSMVTRYLEDRTGNANCILGDSPKKTLRLSSESRRQLLDDSRNVSGVSSGLKKRWESYLKGINPSCILTFEAECAEKNRDAFFITPTHPLAKQAASSFPLREVQYINFIAQDTNLKTGKYPFALYAWDYVGYKTQCRIVPICEENTLQQDIMDLLLYSHSVDVNMPKDNVWDNLEHRHLLLWATENNAHKENAKLAANFKLESLNNSYRHRKLAIEQQIAEVYDGNIHRMKQSELDNMTAQHLEKVNALEESVVRADIHVALLVRGIIQIESAKK